MNEVRRAVWSVDPDLALHQVHTLDYYYRGIRTLDRAFDPVTV